MVVVFLDPEGTHKFDLTQFVISLLLLDLSICLLEMGQPVSHFLSLDGGAEDVDAGGSQHLQPDPGVVLTIHDLNNYKGSVTNIEQAIIWWYWPRSRQNSAQLRSRPAS